MENVEREGLIARGLKGLRKLWRGVVQSAQGGAQPESVTHLSARQLSQIRHTLNECVQEVGGQVSARARAAELGEIYLGLPDPGRREFLLLVAREFGPDFAAVDAAVDAYRRASDGSRALAAARLAEALRPPRLRIFTQFNALPQGVKFLVDLRADVLRMMRDTPELAILDRELEGLLASWFDVGFLELRRITWESPAVLLEKLFAYEAVHEIRSWSDLRHRLDADRRCYAFFHPQMPDEPLIFVEVALVRRIADSIQALLDERAPVGDPRKADTAVFYSISNTQRGLRGVSFGHFLLKRVIDDLREELPNLKTFVTLSPVPLFRRWLQAKLEGSEPLLTAAESKRLLEASGTADPEGGLRQLLSGDDWIYSAPVRDALQAPLIRLCARYLLEAKEGGRPLDPVARFHLGNGARLERINWLADTSPKGMRQSLGVMVNYLYDLKDIEDNHERYARSGEVVVSGAVKSLLKQGRSV
ncbi:malonyl-CoA decarboxylase [Pelomicrobium methylotrophicum]|uniref:Malonyl-CoA decarboxylase n=1 Tax=Pelomicrobium methylotrophicum TaxID=2602750 RepID=A0A5C7ETL4_9PROT|nr:malonyl-CoA decarboxylase [Pelomicrobium methylotrophicum]TXF12043.1 malonyl-CoA decarboxylase [Pelomicrobium methylotrophicum]